MKTVHYLCAFILLLLIGCSSGGGDSGPTAPTSTEPTETTISLESSSSQVSNGSTFTVAVKAYNVSNLFGAGFSVKYDSSKLEVTGMDNGGFLPSYVWVYETSGSTLTAGISSQADSSGNATGVNGSGTLCNITFKAKATGSVTISITSPKFYDPNYPSSAATVPDIGSSVTVTIN